MAIIQTGLWMSLIESIEITEDWSVMMFLTSGQRKIQDKNPCHRFATYWKNKLTSDRDDSDDSDDDDDDDAESKCERWPCCTKSFLTIHRRVDRKTRRRGYRTFLAPWLAVWWFEVEKVFCFIFQSTQALRLWCSTLVCWAQRWGEPKATKIVSGLHWVVKTCAWGPSHSQGGNGCDLWILWSQRHAQQAWHSLT